MVYCKEMRFETFITAVCVLEIFKCLFKAMKGLTEFFVGKC